jgi:hypothetical protein
LYYKIKILKENISKASSYESFVVFEDQLSKLEEEVINIENIKVEGELENVFKG